MRDYTHTNVWCRYSNLSGGCWDSRHSFSFSSVLQGPQLKNPHLAVKHSPIVGGSMALVQGDYLYYHYMQDGFNDNVRLAWLSVLC